MNTGDIIIINRVPVTAPLYGLKGVLIRPYLDNRGNQTGKWVVQTPDQPHATWEKNPDGWILEESWLTLFEDEFKISEDPEYDEAKRKWEQEL